MLLIAFSPILYLKKQQSVYQSISSSLCRLWEDGCKNCLQLEALSHMNVNLYPHNAKEVPYK